MSNTVVFLEEASQLQDWIQENLQLEAVAAPPPANREEIQGYLNVLEVHAPFCLRTSLTINN